MEHKKAFAALMAGLACTATFGAQSTSLSLHRAGPAGLVHYDLATGTVTKVVRPRQAAGLAAQTQVGVQRINVNVFNNTITSGYFTTGSLGAEWVDWAALENAALMTQIRFGYGTSVDDISIGGPGASLDLGFYAGTSGGAGVCSLGAEIRRFTFTGLPGKSASIPPGFGSTYNVTATLAGTLAIPRGQIGWGYTFEDSDGIGGSDTGPVLTDFGTNSGWRNSYQWWSADPASNGSCVGTFSFGGCSTGMVPPPGTGGNPCTSFMLGITAFQATTSASCAFLNAGTNPTALTVTSPPVIGGTMDGVLSPLGGYVLATGTLPGVPLTGTISGLLLVNPATFVGPVVIAIGAFSEPVPADPGLEGLAITIQAAQFAGPGNFLLTNGFNCKIGGGGGVLPALNVNVTEDASGDNFKVITFTVTESDGSPVDNATIRAERVTCAGASTVTPQVPSLIGQTGITGEVVTSFRIEGCTTGPPKGCKWTIEVSKPGFTTATVCVNVWCP